MTRICFIRTCGICFSLILLFCSPGLQILLAQGNGQYHQFELEAGGFLRQYILYVPEGHDGTEKWPLVFNFHGLMATNQDAIKGSKMYAVADTAKFLIAFPQGLIVNCKPLGVVDLGWNIPDNFEAEQDDLAFVNKMITELENDPSYAIDLNRVYAMGGSNGGILSLYLAFELAHRIAAVADILGPISDSLIKLCEPSRPVSILHMQGTDDFLIPAEGTGDFLPLKAVTEYWAGINGCDAVPDSTELEDLDTDDNSTVTFFEYNNCESDYEVLLYRINGGGHTVPGEEPVQGGGGMGNTNMDINANVEIWNFFRRNTRPVLFVHIPDTAFLNALIDVGVDANGDSLISFEEAEMTRALNVDSYGISDMTGLEAFIALDTLSCSDNLIASMDISGCFALKQLDCSNNLLSSLDLSDNPALEELYCSSNHLGSLNLSRNTALRHLSLEGMPALGEVCVWEMPFPSSVEVFMDDSPDIYFSDECGANLVSIPDRAFLYALIEDGVDTNGDSLISYAEALNRDELLLYGGSDGGDIKDATGIEAFINLNSLNLRCNQLTFLDLSNNQELTFLDVGENFLEELDVSGCPLLSTLNVGARRLRCGHKNSITSLDISSNNFLTEIDLSFLDSLRGVCVWTMPYPPDGVKVYKGPDVYFTNGCADLTAPVVMAADSLFQADFLEAISSEDGVIYLVPFDTEKDLMAIRWAVLDSVVSVANAPANISFSGLENGIYCLYACDASGNISDPKLITVLGVGIDKISNKKIRIFPNPGTNLLSIEVAFPDPCSIEITSLNGKQVLNEVMEGNSQQIDLSSFQSGVYFITIRSKNFVSTRKIIKL